MVNCNQFIELLKENNINFFSGVPDSLLKDFCAYIQDNVPKRNHVIAANEGNAVAIAAGHYLATRNPALVYMQNSGQGNAINPLTSLVDPEVYNIPLLLLIGWRGQPGKHDEPQHVKQGKVTLSLLDTIGIPYSILPSSDLESKKVLETAVKYMTEKRAPYALVASEGTFESYKLKNSVPDQAILTREGALKFVLDYLDEKDIIVSTTGKISRELFEYREFNHQGHNQDFLTVGSMGHSSSIALGIALSRPTRNVYCIDGDGSLLMHMGSIPVIGQKAPNNFKHIVLNNFSHDSVGGQPTAASNLDIPGIAMSSGYKQAFSVDTEEELASKLKILKASDGPSLLEIKVRRGARDNLGRPTTTPIQNKEAFMGFIEGVSS